MLHNKINLFINYCQGQRGMSLPSMVIAQPAAIAVPLVQILALTAVFPSTTKYVPEHAARNYS